MKNSTMVATFWINENPFTMLIHTEYEKRLLEYLNDNYIIENLDIVPMENIFDTKEE